MLALGLIVSLCFVPGYTGATIPTQWAVLSILLPLGLWREGAFGPGYLAGLAALAWSAISFLWAPNTHDAAYGFWLLSLGAGCFWLGSTILHFRPLIRGLAIGVTVSSLVAVAQSLGYSPVLTSAGAPPGLFFNPTVLGATAALVIVACASHGLWRYIPGLLPALYLSHSRGAYVILAGTLIARVVPWYIVLTGMLCGFAFLSLAPVPSDIQRLLLWGLAIREFNLLGHGIGSFNTYLFYNPTELYHNAIGLFHAGYVHNDYLQLWFELGVGAIAIYAIYAICLTQRQSAQWSTFFAFFLLGWFYFPLYCPITAFIGCVFAGRIIGDWHVSRSYSPVSRSNILPGTSHQEPTVSTPSRQPLPVESGT